MAKRKKITATDILSLYMNYILEHRSRPKSVYTFAKDNNFDEAIFYEFYASFEKLEQNIFTTFFDNTITALQKSEEYATFDSRNKLLSFYYTFFENLTANRSYVKFALKNHKNRFRTLSVLTSLRKIFRHYIEQLEIETLDLKQDKIEKFQQKTINEAAWIQFLVTIKFWLQDTSESFVKTDIFIEKSINTSFDVINIKPLKSVIDFGKFLFKEKMHTN